MRKQIWALISLILMSIGILGCDADHDFKTDFRKLVPGELPVKKLVFESTRARSNPLNFDCTLAIFELEEGFQDKFHSLAADPALNRFWQSTPISPKVTDLGAESQQLACASARLDESREYYALLTSYSCCNKDGYFSSATSTILIYIPKYNLLFVVPRYTY